MYAARAQPSKKQLAAAARGAGDGNGNGQHHLVSASTFGRAGASKATASRWTALTGVDRAADMAFPFGWGRFTSPGPFAQPSDFAVDTDLQLAHRDMRGCSLDFRRRKSASDR